MLSVAPAITRTNIKKFFGLIKFDNLKIYQKRKDTIHEITPYIAHKSLGEYELIAMNVHGYENPIEWAGNVSVGKSGPHEVFSIAAEETYAALKDYINTNNYADKNLSYGLLVIPVQRYLQTW